LIILPIRPLKKDRQQTGMIIHGPMVIDHLNNSRLYSSLHPDFEMALDYLARTDLSKLEQGKIPLGEGVVLSLNNYETRPAEGVFLEAHQNNIDIQFIVSGRELIGYAPKDSRKLITPYSPEKDVAFYQPDCDFLTLTEGMFAIFFPGELHMPAINPGQQSKVKKIVIKVRN